MRESDCAFGREYLEIQVAQNNRPLYPKVAHYWFKVAHNYEPLALQVGCPGCRGEGFNSRVSIRADANRDRHPGSLSHSLCTYA